LQVCVVPTLEGSVRDGRGQSWGAVHYNGAVTRIGLLRLILESDVVRTWPREAVHEGLRAVGGRA